MNQSKRTRRDFLKTTAGISAASMAAPYFFTGTAKADEPKSDKLTIASIGVGGRGSDIGNQAADLGNTVACADVHLGNANNFAKRFNGKCQVYQDYRKVLDRKDVQAVTIGTPDHWHVKIAIDAMKAGKHVYSEKPLTLTLDEGRLACEAVKKYGKIFQVGTQQRSEYGRGFLKAVAIARSGRLGKNLHAVSSVGKAASRSKDKNAPFGPFQT
jgi:myo-inositol 2-dehydrogenase/D-chiro-inositol 1-dehydrogenase